MEQSKKIKAHKQPEHVKYISLLVKGKAKQYYLTCHIILAPVITAQKMKFSIKDFSSKCDQIRNFLRIWSDLLVKSLMEDFIFCAVDTKSKTQ